MPSVTSPRPRPASTVPGGAPGPAERRVVTGLMVLIAVGLAAAATLGTLAALLAVGAAAFLVLLGLAGRERTAILFMMVGFATAPMYKGLAPSPETPITPTDLALGVGVVLLIPSLLRKRLELPVAYTVGVILILVTGVLSTVFSPAPLVSTLQFVQWLVVLVGLIGLIALWSPTWRVVDLLVWSYVGGQVLSVLYSPIDDSVGNRHIGLSHHPNAFGEAGVMAFALCLYLWRRNEALWYRAAVVAGMGAGAMSAVTSGSRAATVVIAGLVVMIPFVERSAVKGFLLALSGAIGLVALPIIISSSGDSSALARLAGTGDALVADQARLDAQDLGIKMFLEHPLVGNGFADAIYVHNIPLGVLASIGIIGFFGYLLVLFVLARPIIGDHPQRRLAYAAWAFIAITPTVPGLEDRTLWVPMAPAILLAIQTTAWRAARRADADVPTSTTSTTSTISNDATEIS